MRQKTSKTPKARNDAAHKSLQTYFARIYTSVEDRNEEYLQMKKYVRVYEESLDLLGIKKIVDSIAGRIYEVNMANKLNSRMMNQLAQLLDGKNRALRGFIRNKKVTIQLRLLFEITKNNQKIINNIQKITHNVTRINDVIPVIKAILKMNDDDDFVHPVLLKIADALKIELEEPDLTQIKESLTESRINLSKYDAKLNFEDMNDVSDKLIGLLNDKLLLIIGVSEFLIEGIDDGGAHDVEADMRLPDELRALFLTSNALGVFQKLKEIKLLINDTLMCVRHYMQISKKMNPQFNNMLRTGGMNVHDIISRAIKNLQLFLPIVDNVVKKMEKINLEKAIRLTHALIYEKSNRIWENPYKM